MRYLAYLLLSGVAAAFTAQADAVLHVSPQGSDAADGTAAAPFASIARALAAAESGAGDTVRLEAGTYTLDAPLTIGAWAQGFTLEAAAGAEVIVTGGRVVTDFAPVTDAAVLDRMDEAARKHVVQADLKAMGIADFGSPGGGGLEVFFNGEAMTLSRWPNEGFTKILREVGGDPFDVRGRTGDRIGKWTYRDDRPERWVNEHDVWVHGYWFWDWADERHKVKTIDPEAGTIEVEPPYHSYGYRKGQWYYAYNLLPELDTPGEWYLDREAGLLYLWPPAPLDNARVVVTVLPNLLDVSQASGVTLRGITWEACRGRAIAISGGDGNRVEHCVVRNIGGSAISADGANHTIADCELYGLGAGGISLSGGDRATLTPGGHAALNNNIHDYGRIKRMYSAAISLSGVGLRAAHNHIHHAPHMAIGFGGNDHLIEYNEIDHVCQESNDAGAIYAGRDWTERGTKVRFNYLHHINGFEDKGCVGVYLDDMFCGTEISGNLFYKTTRAAFIGGGRDCLVQNNLFVDCDRALHIDNRAQNWASFHVETTMKDRLDAMPYQTPPWSERYPELLTLWDDDPAAPKGNRIVRNIFVGERWNDISDGAAPYIALEHNLTDAAPGFADPGRIAAGGDLPATAFTLEDDAPAVKAGFQPLPLDKMGNLK
ncbi:MAG: hypothetical protein GC168_00565 [Candidatus Hydrogenedens sp.]|nr:hypothetical protein [Candidatus Hydrogenedens sp.]